MSPEANTTSCRPGSHDSGSRRTAGGKLQEASKTEVQRVTERAEKAERELATARAAALRAEVATIKGTPGELAARLQGATREELEADADALKGLVGGPRTPRPTSAHDGREPSNQGDWLRQAFSR
jgi:hypothetical protein